MTIEEPTPEEVQAVHQAVETLLATPRVEELVAAYFDPREPFAGDTFRTLQPNRPNRIGEVDLLAVQLLVNVPPRAVRELLDCADEVEPLLERIPAGVALWDATGQDLVRGDEAFDRLDECHGVGGVIAGKLLARKRPALVPIVDTVVREVLCLPDSRGLDVAAGRTPGHGPPAAHQDAAIARRAGAADDPTARRRGLDAVQQWGPGEGGQASAGGTELLSAEFIAAAHHSRPGLGTSSPGVARTRLARKDRYHKGRISCVGGSPGPRRHR
jgi:hypothetical protein